jgi:MoaA/NifB/PqqE/SkfB family radical SAM enzyme
MFSFESLKTVHIEITNMCQASCPMCARNYHGGGVNPLVQNQSWTLEEFKTIFSSEVLSVIEFVYFCGNFGDPILNSELPSMCRYLKEMNPNIRVHIHTNGGARNTAWWQALTEALPQDHLVVFGIDGLEDTHHLYRVGTTYDNVVKNAKTFIDAGGKAEWCFIKFNHNEHQAEEAKARAHALGFKTFMLKNSSRFLGEPKYSVIDKEGKHTHYIEPPTDNKIQFISKEMIASYKETIMPLKIKCKVQESKEIYIDAYRNVFPCCWLASIPYTEYNNENISFSIRQEIKKQYDALVTDLGGIECLSAINVGVKSVLDSVEWQTVWNTYWNEKKMIVCARICGESNIISDPNDQFIKRDQFQQ